VNELALVVPFEGFEQVQAVHWREVATFELEDP
jgi:hypothetical protein